MLRPSPFREALECARVLASLSTGLHRLKAFAKDCSCDREFVCARVGHTRRRITSRLAALILSPRLRCIENRLFDSGAKLDLLRDTTFELAKNYALILQAWAFFPNHYHLMISFEDTTITHRDFVRHLHGELAMRLNRVDDTSARRVMYEFWDTRLTFEKSWL